MEPFHELPVWLDEYSTSMLRYGKLRLLTLRTPSYYRLMPVFGFISKFQAIFSDRTTVFTVWLPELCAHRSSTLRKQAYFEHVITDILLLSVTLTAAFARTGFATEGGGTGKDPGALVDKNATAVIEKYWLKYTVITIQMLINGVELSAYSTLQMFTAVTTMAGCEFMVNPHEGRLHLQASAQTASRNGGFGTIPALLLEIFLLNEVLLASLSGSRPVVPHDQLAPVVDALLPKMPEFTKRSSYRFGKLLSGSGPVGDSLSSSFIAVMAELYAATEIINVYTSLGGQDQLRETIVLRMFLIGLCLSCVAMECIRLSGLLLIHTTHLKGTPKQHLYDRVATELLERLRQLDDVSTGGPQPLVALMDIWASFLGAFVSMSNERGVSYLHRISRAASDLPASKKEWVQIREWLKRFPCVDEEFDEPFEQIWVLAHH
ncbi:hypothetical protein PV08_02986 [Exophiala spinifera]|uniref:Transcription factor domain-containing protein n=1 Tax=Exophiala spinifera TaxID=91928 RepID=A0A0D2A142_9EURO|nr:uncharacterized protein PV08_02986 [Exophiala spinifera]KIW18697.1 hypothetical protein PV08_02986 [Exophiala spinifera]